MANAKKCDRCGKLFESSLHGGTEVDLTISNGSERTVTFCCGSMFSDLDLCSDCVELFKHWWANANCHTYYKAEG